MSKNLANLLLFFIFFKLYEASLAQLCGKYLPCQYGNIYKFKHFSQRLLISPANVSHFEYYHFIFSFRSRFPEIINRIYNNCRFHPFVEHSNQVVQVIHIVDHDVNLCQTSNVGLIFFIIVQDLDLEILQFLALFLDQRFLQRFLIQYTLKKLGVY